MIAMQYSFTLPADYDMEIIRRRITDKGPALDHHEGLHFKAYLLADRACSPLMAQENLYAPFYLWAEADQMRHFIDGPMFAGVTGAFGWPSVRVWPVWRAHITPEARQARYATREIAPIAPFSGLSDLERAEIGRLESDVAQGALAAVSAYEPTGWTSLRFRLWRDLPDLPPSLGRHVYAVGHVSQPKDSLE